MQLTLFTWKLKLNYSAGGLVTAVAPVVINGNGFWVGWPGIHLEDPNEPIPESDPDDITPTAGLKSEKVLFIWPFCSLILCNLWMH